MAAFKEQEKLNKVLHLLESHAEIKELATIHHEGKDFPIHSIVLGSKNKQDPTLGIFGGVHGIEKVGSHVCLSYLKYLARQIKWDKGLQDLLSKSRIVSIPIVNPVGMFLSQRSNGNGVDIMRNAPCQHDEASPYNLVAGHRLSPKLPWFAGFKGSNMEAETKCLIDFVQAEMYEAKTALSLDIHSGFGLRDRLWFPYSRTSEAFPKFGEATRIKRFMQKGLPFHTYKVEPQSDSYLINGDPWDYLFDQYFESKPKENCFIPWTLEMGSWLWVRKNPKQILSPKGFFNPILPHRYDRVMRRHRHLLDFFHKAVVYHETWKKF